MSTPGYWKIRALLMERQQLERQCKEQIEGSTKRLEAAFIASGLDKSQDYTLNDETETAEPVVKE